MIRSYCAPVIALISLFFSGTAIAAPVTGISPYPMYDLGKPPIGGMGNSLSPNHPGNNSYSTFGELPKIPSFLLDCIRPSAKEVDENAAIVQYVSSESIVFDSKNNILTLYGNSVLDHKEMKLEAHEIVLHLTTHILTAQGIKDQHNQLVGKPILTYKDSTKDRYGKAQAPTTRVFYMDKIEYNIDTKRASVYRLLTKQTDAIVNSPQVKKEDETTFDTQDIQYTTCSLAHPHFYIRAKKAKMIQDQQVTSGPFQFYFDDVPTPLGSFFGVLFLEGKRKHGVVPGKMLVINKEHGFGLEGVGYYVSLGDYADFKIVGNIYENGVRSFEPEFRYQRRYQFNGNINYAQRHGNQLERHFMWKHSTKTDVHNHQSLHINIDYKSEHYDEDASKEKEKHKPANSSEGTVRYNNKIGPYTLAIPLKYKETNHYYKNSNNDDASVGRFKKWELPEVLLDASWRPIKRSLGMPLWCSHIRLNHKIAFVNSLQNLKDADYSSNRLIPSVVAPSSSFNRTCGLKNTIELKTSCTLFNYFNFKPSFVYETAWYGKKLEYVDTTSKPLEHYGLYGGVHVCHFGGELNVNLYQYYFQNNLRIMTTPAFSFTYTPNISHNKAYFQKINKKEDVKYIFEGCGYTPDINVKNRAMAELSCTLSNKIELKTERETERETGSNKKENKTRRIVLLEHLDFKTGIDWNKPIHRLNNISMHIASGKIFIGKMLRASFDLENAFDPYLPNQAEKPEEIKTSFGQLYKDPRSNTLAWEDGKWIGQLRKSIFQIKMELDPKHSSKRKQATSEGKDNDKEPSWHLDWAFYWSYQKHEEYYKIPYTKDRYITLNGNINILKKWLLSASTAYDFIKKEWKLSSTQLSIERDLHCFVMKYKIEPFYNLNKLKEYKYEFSLAFKADALKKIKLPRERSFNTLGSQ